MAKETINMQDPIFDKVKGLVEETAVRAKRREVDMELFGKKKFKELQTLKDDSGAVLLDAEGNPQTKEVEVECTDFGGFNIWYKYEYNAIKGLVENAKSAVTFNAFTQDEFKWYILYLIRERVNLILHGTCKIQRFQDVAIPAFVDQVLKHIGIVSSKEFAVTLKPHFNEALSNEIKANMTDARFKEISDFLLDTAGYHCATRMPNHFEGTVEFMLMQVNTELVQSMAYQKHPAYALLAHFVALEQTNQILNPMFIYAERSQLNSEKYRKLVTPCLTA